MRKRYDPISHNKSTSDHWPFVYSIEFVHPATGKRSLYYGVKYAKGCSPEDLWTIYFTSSRRIYNLIQKYGHHCFRAKVRFVFDNAKEAFAYEQSVLLRLYKNKDQFRSLFLNGNPRSTFITRDHLKGRKLSEEHKRNLSLAKQGSITGDKNPMKNPIARQKISQIQRQKVLSNEVKEHLRNINLGKKHSEDTKAKMSVANSNTSWYNNGSEELRIRNDLIPTGFVKGRLPGQKRKRH